MAGDPRCTFPSVFPPKRVPVVFFCVARHLPPRVDRAFLDLLAASPLRFAASSRGGGLPPVACFQGSIIFYPACVWYLLDSLAASPLHFAAWSHSGHCPSVALSHLGAACRFAFTQHLLGLMSRLPTESVSTYSGKYSPVAFFPRGTDSGSVFVQHFMDSSSSPPLNLHCSIAAPVRL